MCGIVGLFSLNRSNRLDRTLLRQMPSRSQSGVRKVASPHRGVGPIRAAPGPMTPSDSDLIEACLAGDRQAWNELVARYARLVYAITRRKGLSSEDAADVFQEVFAIVYHQLYSLRSRESLAAWIITIAQRESWRHIRHSQPSAELNDTLEDENEDIAEEVQPLPLPPVRGIS